MPLFIERHYLQSSHIFINQSLGTSMPPFFGDDGPVVFDRFQVYRMVKKNRYFNEHPERYGLFYLLLTCIVNILPTELLKAQLE